MGDGSKLIGWVLDLQDELVLYRDALGTAAEGMPRAHLVSGPL